VVFVGGAVKLCARSRRQVQVIARGLEGHRGAGVTCRAAVIEIVRSSARPGQRRLIDERTQDASNLLLTEVAKKRY
jgi:hypothetical protein